MAAVAVFQWDLCRAPLRVALVGPRLHSDLSRNVTEMLLHTCNDPVSETYPSAWAVGYLDKDNGDVRVVCFRNIFSDSLLYPRAHLLYPSHPLSTDAGAIQMMIYGSPRTWISVSAKVKQCFCFCICCWCCVFVWSRADLMSQLLSRLTPPMTQRFSWGDPLPTSVTPPALLWPHIQLFSALSFQKQKSDPWAGEMA